MSPRVTTNPETGQRGYFMEEAAPPRHMRSYTSNQAIIAKPGLIYVAGQLGVEGGLEAAGEALRQMIEGGATFTTAILEEFRTRAEAELEARFGRAKSSGKLVPPHVTSWALKADIGKAIHRGIEHRIKTTLGIESPGPHTAVKGWDEFSPTDQKKVEDGLASFEWWAEEHEFTPLASETIVWVEGWAKSTAPDVTEEDGSPLMKHDAAGQLDVACRYEGRNGILDVKSGKAVYAESWLQVEMQRRGANARQLLGLHYEFAGTLHIPAQGGPVSVHLNNGDALLPDRDRLADVRAYDAFCEAAAWLYGAVEGSE